MKKAPDREMIALAAKAAGIAPPSGAYEGTIDSTGAFIYYDDCEGKTWHAWNPLASDRDAFRLAVALCLSVEFLGAEVRVQHFNNRGVKTEALEDYFFSQDKFAAVRRAIVLVAAAVGRSLT